MVIHVGDTVEVQGMRPIPLPRTQSDAAEAPGAAGAAARLWNELDVAAGREGYAALCWPMRLAAYRATLAADADGPTLAEWRWQLGIWTPAEREDMHRLIDEAHYSQYGP